MSFLRRRRCSARPAALAGGHVPQPRPAGPCPAATRRDRFPLTASIDLKKEGTVSKGAGKKADVNISMSDETFQGLADGKVNAQKAFMTGQLKVKGNIMLATKLSTVLNAAKGTAKA